jgi:hypothetical protein
MPPAHSTRLGVYAALERGARVIAGFSQGALDRSPLASPAHAAELCVSVAAGDAVLAGAFQRARDWPDVPWLRRGSGGAEVRLGEGSVHVALSLAHPAALVACDEKRIVNRYVRPLLRALNGTASTGTLAHYFGRDWVSVAHAPVAWVGFAHDAGTRRTLVEAVVAVRVPFAVRERASFQGKAPSTLEAVRGGAVNAARLAEAIVEAYARDALVEPLDALPPVPPSLADLRESPEPPWAATLEEAIGTLGAGPDARGVFRVGGDLLVSRDALALLERRLAGASDEELPAIIDATLAAPGVALEGVRSLASVLDVVSRARHG